MRPSLPALTKGSGAALSKAASRDLACASACAISFNFSPPEPWRSASGGLLEPADEAMRLTLRDWGAAFKRQIVEARRIAYAVLAIRMMSLTTRRNCCD